MSAGTPLVRRWSGERGYLMVALLVAMSVMAVMMGAALPAWQTLVQREKEAELVFRGEQYARAIGLYQRRFANAPAPSIDVLVEQRFLRKKYKDPITNDDFQILGAGASLPGQTGVATQLQQVQGRLQQAQGALQQAAGRAGGAPAPAQGFGTTTVVGGIVGVTSKSPLKSLRLYNGRDTYNQWIFVPVARAGGPGAGRGGDGRGGRGGIDGRGGDGRGGVDGRGGLDGRGRGGLDGRGLDGRGRGGVDGRGRGLPQGEGGRGGRGLESAPRGRF